MANPKEVKRGTRGTCLCLTVYNVDLCKGTIELWGGPGWIWTQRQNEGKKYELCLLGARMFWPLPVWEARRTFPMEIQMGQQWHNYTHNPRLLFMNRKHRVAVVILWKIKVLERKSGSKNEEEPERIGRERKRERGKRKRREHRRNPLFDLYIPPAPTWAVSPRW